MSQPSVKNRVFISCVSDEFERPEGAFVGMRSQLKHYLSRADCDVKVQEEFRQAGDVDTVAKLAAYIRTCAAVLHLVGEKPGAVAGGQAVTGYLAGEPKFLARYPELRAALGDCTGLAYTQWEALLALHYHVPLFVYASDKADSQAEHLERLRGVGKHHDKRITGSADLLGQLIGDLRYLVPLLAETGFAASRILRHSPPILFGRENWLDALDAAWADPRLNLYTLVAWGGVGKTSLVAHWVAERFMKVGWRDVERYFDWSFYAEGTGESRQTSADFFIGAALEFFGDPDPTVGGAWERGERLARLVRQRRTLLVLDGIEPLQYPPSDKAGMAGRLKDPALEVLIESLAADNPGLCVITTREHLKNVESLPTAQEHKLDRLPKEAAFSLLRHLKIVGTDEELEAAWKDSGGHALTLQLLGRFIADAYPDRDIRHYREVHFVEADELRSEGRSAFKVMIAYERWLASADPERQRELAILRLTGLFDRPIPADCLQTLRMRPPIPGLTYSLVKLKETQWNVAIARLVDIDLLSRSGAGADASIDAHPLVREYFAEQLQRQSPEAFRAAHSRLFDYLCERTTYRPDGLAGLAPLYQAVVHGCLAGRHREACDKVYIDRILRGIGTHDYYSVRKLGAYGPDLGVLAAFFEEPWRCLSPNLKVGDSVWLLHLAATCLRKLGRLTEAVEPMRMSVELCIVAEQWEQASGAAANLSQLETALGRLDDGVIDARRALQFAKLSGEPRMKLFARAAAADALQQVGKPTEAETYFKEAEEIQKERTPQYPLFYGLHGHQFVDLILAPVERAVWQRLLRGTDIVAGTTFEQPSQDALATACIEAERRTTNTSKLAETHRSQLSIALDKLSSAQAILYKTLLSTDSATEIVSVQSGMKSALADLRQASELDHLPKALLSAALCFGAIAHRPDEARRYLDEAKQIAERGPMPLYLADVHMHRARLFRDRDELAKARVLIEKHGYWRRKEELEDAEALIK